MYLDKNTGLTVPGAAPGGGGSSGGCDHPEVVQPEPSVSVDSSTGLVTAEYTPVAGLVEDTSEKSGTLQLNVVTAKTITPGTEDKWLSAGNYLIGKQTIKGDGNLTAGNIKKDVSIFGVTGTYEGEGGSVVTQPAPTVTINKSTGKVTATYTPKAGTVTDTSAKSGTLQLTTQGAQTITPGTSDKTIASDRYLTGVQTIKGDADLVAGNIKKGVSIFNVSGTYEAAATPTIPSTCIAYLGSNRKLYVKQGSGVTVGGLTKQSTTDREGWDAYSGFSSGTLAGSVLSKDGVYLQWDGFKDLNQKWSIHSLMNSGYRESSEVWRVGWGFDRVDDQYGDWDSTLGYGTDVMGFRCMAYVKKPKVDPAYFTSEWEFPDGRAARGVSPVHCVSYGLSWDGNGQTADSKLYYYGDHYVPTHNSGHQKLFEPAWYDEMGGMYMGNAYKYSLGDKLYLGKPAKCEVGEAQSGVMILQFALELKSYGSGDYYCPFFTGAYKNL